MSQIINGKLVEIVERNHSLALAEGGLFFAIKVNGKLSGLADTFDDARLLLEDLREEGF